MPQENRPEEKKEEPIATEAIGFPCRSCGNQMAFSPESGTLFCRYCKTEVAIEGRVSEAPEYFYDPEEDYCNAPKWDAQPGQRLTCPSCGADTVMSAAAMTASCPFCSSHYVTKAPQDRHIITPETMIPFRVGEAIVRQSYALWTKRRWLAPRKFRREAKRPTIRGVYIPYFTFDATLHTKYHGFGGRRRIEHYTVRVNGKTTTRTRTRTDWYPVSGKMDLSFDNLPCPATDKIDRALLNKIGGYSLKLLPPYHPAYLAGFFAERYNIGLSVGFACVRQMMEQRMIAHIEAALGYDTYRSMHYEHRYEQVKFKHILLPLWISSYSFRGKVYQFLVNGENGQVAGRFPISPWKVAALITGGILLLGGLILWLASL